MTNQLPENLKGVHIHFVGIKGTGMAALVEILFHAGAIITGSDVSERFYTDEIIEKLGLKAVEFSENNITEEIQYVIYSSAYKLDKNPDLIAAVKKSIPCLLYTQALGNYSERAFSCGICGVHGKTSTTGLTGTILKELDLPVQVLAGSIINSLGKRIDDLETQMQSFLATASGGEAFSNMYGNSEVMGVTQKALTETMNGLYELIFDALGIEVGDVKITISPDGFFSNEAAVVNIAATADYGLFDFVKVYFDGVKVLEETSIKTFSEDLTIGKTTTIKVEAQVLGKLYTYEKTVTMASDFFIGAGATYEDVYNPQYTRPYDGNPTGQYTIEVAEGQRIIIILPTSDVSKIEQIEMNDFNIPMDTTTFGIYTAYTSLNTYKAGTYTIDINY